MSFAPRPSDQASLVPNPLRGLKFKRGPTSRAPLSPPPSTVGPTVNTTTSVAAQTTDPRLHVQPNSPPPASCSRPVAPISVPPSASETRTFYDLQFDRVEKRLEQRHQMELNRYQHELSVSKQETVDCRRESNLKCEKLQDRIISIEKIRSEERGKREAERKELLTRIESLEKRAKEGRDGMEGETTGEREERERESRRTENDLKLALDKIPLLKRDLAEKERELQKERDDSKEVEESLTQRLKDLEETKKEKEALQETIEQNRRKHAAECRHHKEERDNWQQQKTKMVARLKKERIARDGLVATLKLREPGGEDELEEERPRKRRRGSGVD